jgi:hypothetical protein
LPKRAGQYREIHQIFNNLLHLWITCDIISPTTTKYEKAHRVRTDRLFSISDIRKRAGNSDAELGFTTNEPAAPLRI